MYYKVEKINIRIKHVQHIKLIIKIGAKKKKTSLNDRKGLC